MKILADEVREALDTCPSCGADWNALKAKLESPNVWVRWTNRLGGFWGKSDEHMEAEVQITKCDRCYERFYVVRMP